jgi:hypothetical protein
MDRVCNAESGMPPGGSPPSEAWLFAQLILGKPIPRIVSPEAKARAKREELERLAQFSSRRAEELRQLRCAEAEARRQRELLVWAAGISTEAEANLRGSLRTEAEEREAWRPAERLYETYSASMTEWDEADHPRQPKGTPDGGQWVAKGGASSAGSAATPSSPFRTAAFHAGQASAQLAAFGGAPSATWPTTGPTSSWLPKVGSGVGAGAGAAAGIGAGAFLGGLRNASMGAYWARVPGTQAMPSIWVYELEKRVRDGSLSRQDAIGIFNTAVLGAEAQGFKPTGGTMSAVHKSATDFLGRADAVYFARKKKAAEAGGKTDAGNAEAKPERVTGEALAKARKEFERMKPELWKQEAEKNPDKYTPEQLDSIRQGKTPKDSDGKPLEIHHKKPLSEGGTNTYDNFQFGTREDHRIGTNFKKNHPNLPRGRNK